MPRNQRTTAHSQSGSGSGRQTVAISMDKLHFQSWRLFLSFFIVSSAVYAGNEDSGIYLNKWAVHLDGISNIKEADDIAAMHGFVNHGQIGSLENFYLFEHHGVSKRSTDASSHHVHLQKHSKVRWVEQQVTKRRVKRDYQSPYLNLQDPLWEKQWYLHGGANGGYDMNIIPAWKKGFTGRGVVVTILDDGIEHNHADLKPNYERRRRGVVLPYKPPRPKAEDGLEDPEASWDINGRDPDPMPHYDGSDTNRHGTRCAGEVSAVANNSKCAVGVAYNAKIGGVRMLDGDVSDYVEAQSLSLNPQHIDIYSASWGPDDNGKVVDGPAKLAKEAFIQGILKGRHGKGSIFVWASGNGGSQYDSCNCDGYTNSLFTLSISSVSERGRKPWYLEECSSTLATTYSSGENYGDRKIITTDLHGECTEAHTGTSASAPLAAAICALALEANPELTWRDMQYIVMRTARPEPLLDGDWVVNGVGRKVSLKYGYGLMDAAALVDLAQRWNTVPDQHICASSVNVLHMPIDSEGIQLKVDMDGCTGTSNAIRYLEHVQAKVSLQYSRRGDVQLHLVSPNGTRTMLLQKRKNDYQEGEFRDWPFMSVHFWGENPTGTWRLEVENVGSPLNTGTFIQWQLIIYGTASDPISLRPIPVRTSTTQPNGPPVNPVSIATTTPSTSSQKDGKPEKGSKAGKTGKHVGLDESWNHDVDDDDDTDNDGYVDAIKDGHKNLQADLDEDGQDMVHGGNGMDKANQGKGDNVVHTENESWLPSKEWNLGPNTKVACHYECEAELGCRGPNPQDCHTCLHVRLSPSGPCVAQCPVSTYPDLDTGLCMPCDSSCVSCSGADESDCLTCPTDRYLMESNHTCLEQCPPGYLPRGTVCGPCALPCVSCEASPDRCLTCEPDWELVDNTCHPPCQLYHYRLDDRCEACVANCEVCTGPFPEDCIACGHGRLLQNHTCVFACSERYFPTTTNHGEECLECHPTCLNCNGGGEDECTDCAPPRTLHNQECLILCKEGEYKTPENECQTCDPSCRTCSGKSGYDCLSCPPNKYLHNGECMSECPEGYFPTGSDDKPPVCAKCLPPCRNCQDSPTHCNACLEGFVLEGASCSVHCGSGEYRGREGCETCHPTCSECNGPEVTQCSACPSSRHLHQGTCVSDCPMGYHGTKGHCHKCDDSCLSCQGSGTSNCLSCSSDFMLVDGVCVPQDNATTGSMRAAPLTAGSPKKCDDGYFLNSSTQMCTLCDESCATCDGWGPYRCVTCASPHRFYGKLSSCVLCCSAAVSHSCCSCHPKTGVCMENRNIDYENIPQQERHMFPTQRSVKQVPTKPCLTPENHTQNGILALVVIFCLFSLTLFFVIFGVLQARSNKRMCWYRHYQPVPMYYHDGSEQVTLSKEDYQDEDSVSSA